MDLPCFCCGKNETSANLLTDERPPRGGGYRDRYDDRGYGGRRDDYRRGGYRDRYDDRSYGRRDDYRGGDRYRDDRYGDRRGGGYGYDRPPRGPPPEAAGYGRDPAPPGDVPPPRSYDDRRRYD